MDKDEEARVEAILAAYDRGDLDEAHALEAEQLKAEEERQKAGPDA